MLIFCHKILCQPSRPMCILCLNLFFTLTCVPHTVLCALHILAQKWHQYVIQKKTANISRKILSCNLQVGLHLAAGYTLWSERKQQKWTELNRIRKETRRKEKYTVSPLSHSGISKYSCHRYRTVIVLKHLKKLGQ